MACKIVDNIIRHFDNIEVCTQTVPCFIQDQRMGNGDYNVRKKVLLNLPCLLMCFGTICMILLAD